jgi:hypothetical protein
MCARVVQGLLIASRCKGTRHSFGKHEKVGPRIIYVLSTVVSEL